jgi:hypothetical protein
VRCFLTSDGGVLVEWAAGVSDPGDFLPRRPTGTFYLLDAAGEIGREWSTTWGSIDDTLGRSTYAVEDDALIDYYAQRTGEGEPAVRRSVELAGLRPLPLDAAPAETAIAAAIERREENRSGLAAEEFTRDAERLARFERALPVLAGSERISLVWRYDGSDIVISRPAGEELWRESGWHWHGKALYVQLQEVAERLYGARLAGFAVELAGHDDDRFDPGSDR